MRQGGRVEPQVGPPAMELAVGSLRSTTGTLSAKRNATSESSRTASAGMQRNREGVLDYRPIAIGPQTLHQRHHISAVVERHLV